MTEDDTVNSSRYSYNKDFWDWKVASRQNQDFSILIETSQSSRQAFWSCQDFLDRQDKLFDSVQIKSLDRDHLKTNRDPQAYLKLFNFPNTLITVILYFVVEIFFWATMLVLVSECSAFWFTFQYRITCFLCLLIDDYWNLLINREVLSVCSFE